MNLKDKTIIITGASKGLGRELAIRLSYKYSNIILVARNLKLLEQVQKEIEKLTGNKPFIISCDISNESNVKQMTEIIQKNFNKVDVLVNNAGIGIHKISENLTNSEMKKLFEINFYGTYYCTKTLLPLIQKSNCGYILNISSLAGKAPLSNNSVYAATKSALSCFTEGLYYELKNKKIKTGLFLPGLMKTTFHDDIKKNISKTPSFLILNPGKAALKLEQMIKKRKKRVYMYRWMILFLKIKQLFN